MQKIIQEFDADFTKFEEKFKKMAAIVDAFARKAASVKVDFASGANLNTDVKSINEKLTKIKEFNFDAIEKKVASLNDKLKPLNQELSNTLYILDKIGNKSREVAGDIKTLVTELNLLNKESKKINNSQNDLNNTFSKTSNNSKIFGTNIGNNIGFIGSMTNSIQRLLPFLSALFVVNAVIKFAQELYNVNRQFELFELKAKSALYGSKLAVDEYYKSLQRIDIKSLFDIEELETGLVKLLNRRINLTEAELQSLANTAESVGTKGAQSFNQIVEALLDAQVGQFKRLEELGVGVDAKGEKIKLTFAGVTTEVDKGSQAIIQYILGLDKMNGAFELSNQTAFTLEGKVSSLRTSFSNLIKKSGELGLTSAFKTILDESNSLLVLLDKILTKLEKINLFDTSDFKDFMRGAIAGGAAGAIAGGVGAIPGAVIGGIAGVAIGDTRDKFGIGKDNLAIEKFMKRGPEYEKMVKKLISVNDELFLKGKDKNNITGNVFFNPSNLSTNELKNYVAELQVYIRESQKLGLNKDLGKSGQLFKTSTDRLSAIQQEITGRGFKADDKTDDNKINRFNESMRDMQARADREKIDALNDIVKKEEQIKIEALKEQLRFLKEGSVKYLELKRIIGLQEIELDREVARLSLKEKLKLLTGTPYKNSAGNVDMQYTEPSDKEVTEKFKKENDIFNVRKQLMNTLTNEAIKDSNEKFADEQKSLFDKLADFVEGSQDKERKAIIQKYNSIQKESLKLRDYLLPEQQLFLNIYDKKLKILEEFELKLLDIQNAQKGSVEASKASVQRNPNETNYSFNRRVESAGLEQESDNAKELLSFSDFFALEYPILSNDPSFKAILEKLTTGYGILIDKLKANAEKQKVQLSFSDNIISKVFGLDPDSKTFNKEADSIRLALNQVYDVYQQFVSSLIDLEKKKEEEADKNIQRLEKRLDAEKELKRQGIANNYDMLMMEIAGQERLKKDAADKQIKLQKLQIASNAAMAISNLIGTNINLVFGASKLPFPASVIVAGLSIASMVGILASGIAQFKAVGKAEEGGILGGKRHHSGGTLIEAEEGEGFIRRASSLPNKNLVLNLNNFKKKVTGDNLHELLAGTGVTFGSQGNDWKETSNTFMEFHKHHFETNQMLIERFEKLEKSLEGIESNTSRISSKQITPMRDGRIMIMDGNSTQIIE